MMFDLNDICRVVQRLLTSPGGTRGAALAYLSLLGFCLSASAASPYSRQGPDAGPHRSAESIDLQAESETDTVELFLIWGMNARWDGGLEIVGGRFSKVAGFSLEQQHGDRLAHEPTRLNWRSGTRNGVDGVHIWVRLEDDGAVLVFRAGSRSLEIPLATIEERGQRRIQFGQEDNFVIVGYGSPVTAQPRVPPLLPSPPLFELPVLGPAVALPDCWFVNRQTVKVRLPCEPLDDVLVRRGRTDGDRLLIEIGVNDNSLRGIAEISYGDRRLADAPISNGQLWLSLLPRIDRLDLQVSFAGTDEALRRTVPTTLVQVRKREIYLNGEPFLMKGALARNLNFRDAEYIRSIGINTLRGRQAVEYCNDFHFMGLVSAHAGPGKICNTEKVSGKTEFLELVDKYVERLEPRALNAVASPYTLIVQVANEQAYGNDSWAGRVGQRRPFERLDYLLTRTRNLVKRLDPMLPVGYANHASGYRAPSFLDVYQHNSFLNQDRYQIPWETFMEFQGCLASDEKNHPGRPFVNSEFGANVYLCQAYHGGPNNPVLEKLHAWNYRCRWNEFMEHDTVGGACYCLYDLESSKDQGCSRFGIMTYDRKVKLACWEIWQLWRDFNVTPIAGGAADAEASLEVAYRRDYAARDCRLTLLADGERPHTTGLEDFEPRTCRTVILNGSVFKPFAEGFRWQLDFTTHRGLVNQATGAWPRELEEHDFLERLSRRDAFPFLRELFDAEVLTVDARPPPRTLDEMTNADGIIPVALRKPNGVVYLVLITRENPNQESPIRSGINLQVSFSGRIEAVNDMTGARLSAEISCRPTSEGLLLRDLRAARIPGPIGKRAEESFAVPVYRITPE